MPKKEIDRIRSVIDRVEGVDLFHYVGEVYGLTRTWPHTHVDEPRSFNKFRKQILKPSVGYRNHEDCCQALSCAAVLGVCTREIAMNNRLPELHVHRAQCVVEEVGGEPCSPPEPPRI